MNSSQSPQPCQCPVCRRNQAALQPPPQYQPRIGPQSQSEYSGAGEVPLVPGTLWVYRSWFVNEDGWLQAINFPAVWGPGLNVAHCMGHYGGGQRICPMPRVPGPACTCGFYGIYDFELFDRGFSLGAVNGVVEVSGRVILGTKGVRAQKARIVAAVVSGYSFEMISVMEHYPNVRWLSSSTRMMEAFPPQDVSELIGKPEPEPLYSKMDITRYGSSAYRALKWRSS